MHCWVFFLWDIWLVNNTKMLITNILYRVYAIYMLYFEQCIFFCLSHLFYQSVNKPKDWYKSMFKQIHKKPEGMCSHTLSLSETMRKFLSVIVCHILHGPERIKPNSGLEMLDLISRTLLNLSPHVELNEKVHNWPLWKWNQIGFTEHDGI